MPDDPETARAKAEAKFNKKQIAAEQGADARAHYDAAGKAALDRMAQLKALRLAHEASQPKETPGKRMGRKGVAGAFGKAKRPKPQP